MSGSDGGWGTVMNTTSTPGGWWYVANGQKNGPVSDQELQRLLIGGTLGPHSPVWKQGMERWQHLGQVQSLSDRLASLPPALPPASTGVVQRAGRNAATNKKGFARWKFVFLSFRGRIDRETYWLWSLILYLVMLCVALLSALPYAFIGSGGSVGSYLTFTLMGLSIVGYILVALWGYRDFRKAVP